MGLHQSDINRRRREDAKATKLCNRAVKTRERERRDARMIALIKTGSPPYTPAVQSWLSRKLDKKASRITSADIKPLLS